MKHILRRILQNFPGQYIHIAVDLITVLIHESCIYLVKAGHPGKIAAVMAERQACAVHAWFLEMCPFRIGVEGRTGVLLAAEQR